MGNCCSPAPPDKKVTEAENTTNKAIASDMEKDKEAYDDVLKLLLLGAGLALHFFPSLYLPVVVQLFCFTWFVLICLFALPGDSGKSTLFKQVIHLYGNGFDNEQRAQYANICWTNTILYVLLGSFRVDIAGQSSLLFFLSFSAMKTLITQSLRLDSNLKCRLSTFVFLPFFLPFLFISDSPSPSFYPIHPPPTGTSKRPRSIFWMK
jgi:hypothetical protein